MKSPRTIAILQNACQGNLVAALLRECAAELRAGRMTRDSKIVLIAEEMAELTKEVRQARGSRPSAST